MISDKVEISITRDYDSPSAANFDRKCFRLKIRKRSLPVDNEILFHDEDMMAMFRYFGIFIDKYHKEKSKENVRL